MALKKSELYASLWKSCDELRGGMDASQYKDYVLVLLFVKYVSDKASSQTNYLLDVPAGASFVDMVALRGDKDIGEKINKIIHRLAEANDLTGVIDVADFNDPEKLGRGKEMVDRLSNLIGIFNSPALDFRSNRAEGDDLLGDAYEYLMRHFATESGKSKGQFYTPAEVSRILAKVVGMGTARSAGQTVYDPACGSGSLLLKAHDEAQSVTGLDLAIYGQEMDVATAALARMNMILHDAPTAEITPGGSSTLANPQFRTRDGSLKTFDFVVANPPFSNKAWRNGFDPANDEFGRFSAPYVLPPAKNGDYAFLLHILASLKSTGKAAVILPHGVLFRPNAEAQIRREIVRRGYIKGIIGLPPNLFYGTGIAACVVLLDKEQAATRTGIFMIDASNGFRKDGAKNRLRDQDIHKIVDIFNRGLEAPRYSRFVALEEIEANDFNLSLSRYIDSSAPEDIQDIDGHLRGGIPDSDVDALAAYWDAFPTLRAQLFESVRPGYSEACVPVAEIAQVIRRHPDVQRAGGSIRSLLLNWRRAAEVQLLSFGIDGHPKELGDQLAEALLSTSRAAPLIDPYDIYQRYMDFWARSMQDDAYLIAEAGWRDAAQPRFVTIGSDKASRGGEFELDGRRLKSDLIPADLLLDAYFAADRDELDAKSLDIATTASRFDGLLEEHGVEGGLLEDLVDDNGKLSKSTIGRRLKEIAGLKGTAEYDVGEDAVLAECSELLRRQADLKRDVKDLRAALAVKIAQRYAQLTEQDVKNLVVAAKWLDALHRSFDEEIERSTRMLAERSRQLAERYAEPLPNIVERTERLTQRVDGHLRHLVGGEAW